MDAIAFTTRQHANLFLLIRATEVEATHVGARRRLVVADLYQVLIARDFLPHGLAVVEAVARLVHGRQLDCGAERDAATVGLLRACDHAKQCCLARAVCTDHTHDAARRQHEAQIVDQQFIVIAFPEVFDFDNDVAQPRAGRYVNLVGLITFLVTGRGQFRKLAQSRLGLCLTSLRIRAHPLKFGCHRLLACFFGRFFVGQAFFFLFQPVRVVAFVGNAVATIQFENPAGYVVEEVAIMCDGDNRTRVFVEEAFQPCD